MNEKVKGYWQNILKCKGKIKNGFRKRKATRRDRMAHSRGATGECKALF